MGVQHRFNPWYGIDCLPSDMIEAPESLKSLHPICIVKGLSAGRVGCPLRINAASPVRSTPGVLIGPFPFVVEGAREGAFAVTTSVAKFSKSDRDCPERLETTDPPCVSSPTHRSCTVLFTANIACTLGCCQCGAQDL